VKDQGYDGKQEQQVNQATGHVKNGEAGNPGDQQNHE
jgi:hypothetical protein